MLPYTVSTSACTLARGAAPAGGPSIPRRPLAASRLTSKLPVAWARSQRRHCSASACQAASLRSPGLSWAATPARSHSSAASPGLTPCGAARRETGACAAQGAEQWQVVGARRAWKAAMRQFATVGSRPQLGHLPLATSASAALSALRHASALCCRLGGCCVSGLGGNSYRLPTCA